MQKVIIVTGYWDDDNDGKWSDSTENINKLLEKGWKVINMIPMGAYGYGFAGGYGYSASSHDMSQYQPDSELKSNEDAGFASLLLLEK